jgi:hypothetical protein
MDTLKLKHGDADYDFRCLPNWTDADKVKHQPVYVFAASKVALTAAMALATASASSSASATSTTTSSVSSAATSSVKVTSSTTATGKVMTTVTSSTPLAAGETIQQRVARMLEEARAKTAVI